jgi:hypothetical protein
MHGLISIKKIIPITSTSQNITKWPQFNWLFRHGKIFALQKLREISFIDNPLNFIFFDCSFLCCCVFTRLCLGETKFNYVCVGKL